jgi:uncharacterized protein (DUF1810 family)
MVQDEFNLNRFLTAQDALPFDVAVSEIIAGKKTGHWIWYVFPQLCGLGQSENSRFYGIASLDEAQAYMLHPILRTRLLDAIAALLDCNGQSVESVFGGLDAMKVRSSVTLFSLASDEPIFRQVLAERFDGTECEVTLKLLARA